MKLNTYKLNKENFRRKTGVKKETFNLMIEILNKEEKKKLTIGGRPSKLSTRDVALNFSPSGNITRDMRLRSLADFFTQIRFANFS